MPYSNKNLFPKNIEEGEDILVSRWELIKESLSKPIKYLEDFEKALRSYNFRFPKPTALQHLFFEVFSEEETQNFFNVLLPGIIDLALKLPEIVPDSIPLLKSGSCKSISFSQHQVSCILANAFLCTFPTKKEDVNYHSVNFASLFASNSRPKRVSCVIEKLKCILHYFQRILNEAPVGVITFERKHVNRSFVPRWDKLETNLGNTRVHITSESCIEDGLGFLQVDFANKFVGGGVLGYGCVQEEIRFIINPELIISRLFTEKLEDSEALLVIGTERFSNYKGYSDAFTFDGDCRDDVPFDQYGRRITSIVAIDATRFNKVADQFGCHHIIRELNKSYAGFHSRLTGSISAVATGNWGCGAFGGNVHLKFLIQLMACSASNRDMVYYTFSDPELREKLYDTYMFLAVNQITICKLWRLLCGYNRSKIVPETFLSYIQQSYFDSKSQPSIKSFFNSEPVASTSKTEYVLKVDVEESVVNDCKRMEISPVSKLISPLKTIIKNLKVAPIPKLISPIKSDTEDLSPPNTKRKRIKSDDDLINLFKLFDDDKTTTTIPNSNNMNNSSLLECIDDYSRKNKKAESTDVYVEDILESLSPEEESKTPSKLNSSKKKITDYFSKK
ncbi:PREDICTED: poly(ADP-ribose) glycohydrolase-like isoform X2 [Nicrophorus vespilloides]|nr:PREDICTED: poly(ADP-ribose) glycohydrolase-like isoform X2 [Nicrophorus vespilloides]